MTDFDKLLTGCEPVERELHFAVKTDLEQLEREGFVLPKDENLSEKQQQALETAYDGKQRESISFQEQLNKGTGQTIDECSLA